MDKIDEKFKERDGKLDILKSAYQQQRNRIDNLEKILVDIKDKLIELKDIIDEENESEDEECEDECTCDAVDIGEEIRKFLQGFAYKAKKKD